MQYRLLHRLGQYDARKCNMELGTSLSLEAKDLAPGCIVELTPPAHKWLTGSKAEKCKGYVALLEPVGAKVRGDAKEPEVKAPSK